MSFKPKPSKALPLWLGILAVVLLLLFVETQGPQHGGSNFFINTDSSAEGAQVLVDGQRLGVLGSAGSSGMGGGAFWGHLTRGPHLIQIQKPGFQTFSKEIDMHGEEYLGVDLIRTKD